MNRVSVLALCVIAHAQTHAVGPTPLTLVASSTQAQPVVTCLSANIEPRVKVTPFSTGLEARVALHAMAHDVYFSVNLLLKPDVYSLLANLDEAAEAHPELQVALLENLRHPVAMQIYPWDSLQDCRAAAKWLSSMSRQAIDLSPQK